MDNLFSVQKKLTMTAWSGLIFGAAGRNVCRVPPLDATLSHCAARTSYRRTLRGAREPPRGSPEGNTVQDGRAMGQTGAHAAVVVASHPYALTHADASGHPQLVRRGLD